MFGTWRDGMQPNRAYRWETEAGTIAELPVTTMPAVRTPIHISYLLWLSRFSMPLAELYLRIGLTACRVRRQGPSILLHPLDLLGGDEVDELEFFPGMDLAGAVKRSRTSRFVELLTASFEVATCLDHVVDLRPLARTRTP